MQSRMSLGVFFRKSPKAAGRQSVKSVQKRGLFHVSAQALFRQGSHVIILCNIRKGNAVACSKPPALETCSDSV